MKKKYFSIVIPTMWKSEKLKVMLDIYQKSNLVKEIIIIDNNPKEKFDISNYSKIKYYTENKNLFVNPSWNIGYTFSNYELILANDDVIIYDIDSLLPLILESDYDIIGIDLKSKNSDEIQLIDLPKLDDTKSLGDNLNGFGCFMYIKNYQYIPDDIKIWYGDDFLVYNSIKKGLIKNLKVDYTIGTTVGHVKNNLGKQILERDRLNFLNWKNSLEKIENQKVLAVLVNYGFEQIDFLEEMVKSLKSFKKYDVNIIVNSNVELKIDGIDKLNLFNNLSDYQLLPLTCRKTIWENKDNYDLFLYGENDMLFKEVHLDRHIEYTKILPQDRICGLLRYEEDERGIFYTDYHAFYEWDFDSVEVYNGKKFAHFKNVHQATFILTNEQLNKVGELHNFNTFFRGSSYSSKCKVNTDIYDFCGMRKLICLSDFKDNLIHHMSNVYIDGINGRNKNQRSDSKRMETSLIRLMTNSKIDTLNGFYLNLKRRSDRMEKMELEIQKTSHNIVRYEAIDGNNLKSLDNFKGSIPTSEIKQYATFLSHLKMIKLAKQKGWDKLIILEDDVTLCSDFDARLKMFLNNLPSDWKIAYLGFTETPNTKLNQISEYTYRVNETYGCFGMVINGNFYDTLIKTLEKSKIVIDWVIKDQIQPKYGCYAFIPFLLYVNDDYSDLWNFHRKLDHIKKYYKEYIEPQRTKIELPKQKNSHKVRKILNLNQSEVKTIDYDLINQYRKRPVNTYDVSANKKPVRESLPENRNTLIELKKDSLTKVTRDFFSKGKKFKG